MPWSWQGDLPGCLVVISPLVWRQTCPEGCSYRGCSSPTLQRKKMSSWSMEVKGREEVFGTTGTQQSKFLLHNLDFKSEKTEYVCLQLEIHLCQWDLFSTCAGHLISLAVYSVCKIGSWRQYPLAFAFCLLYLTGLKSSCSRNCFLMCTSVYKGEERLWEGTTLSQLCSLVRSQTWSVPSQLYEKFGW